MPLSLHPPPHVRHARHDPDSRPRRQTDHASNSFSTTRSASVFTEPGESHLPFRQLDLNRARAGSADGHVGCPCHPRLGHANRQQSGYPPFLRAQEPLAILPSPGEHLVGVYPVRPRHACHRRTWRQGFPPRSGALTPDCDAAFSLRWVHCARIRVSINAGLEVSIYSPSGHPLKCPLARMPTSSRFV